MILAQACDRCHGRTSEEADPGDLRFLTISLSLSDMSQVIYARVPDALKEAVDAYAEERGVTLTSAVVDLLGRGMAAASDERSVADLETKLAKTTVEKAKVESKLETAMNELGGLRAFAERAAQEIGKCPKCGEPITGYDLLARGQCRHCETSWETCSCHTRQSHSLTSGRLDSFSVH